MFQRRMLSKGSVPFWQRNAHNLQSLITVPGLCPCLPTKFALMLLFSNLNRNCVLKKDCWARFFLGVKTHRWANKYLFTRKIAVCSVEIMEPAFVAWRCRLESTSDHSDRLTVGQLTSGGTGLTCSVCALWRTLLREKVPLPCCCCLRSLLPRLDALDFKAAN